MIPITTFLNLNSKLVRANAARIDVKTVATVVTDETKTVLKK